MSKVFVTHENISLDYSLAEEYGELVFITADDFSSMKTSAHNIGLVDTIKSVLRTYKPDEDYIIATGSPMVNAAVFMLIGCYTPVVKVLRWSNRDRKYTPVTINIG